MQPAFEDVVQTKEEQTENGKKTETVIQQNVVKPLPLESSHINVDLNLEHRQKGLLWYSTYKVAFDGAYAFHNTTDKEQNVTFSLAFPTAHWKDGGRAFQTTIGGTRDRL